MPSSQNPRAIPLRQGSQTQIDSRAAWDLKQDLAGRIKKVKKKILFEFPYKYHFISKRRQNVLKKEKSSFFLLFAGCMWPAGRVFETPALRPWRHIWTNPWIWQNVDNRWRRCYFVLLSMSDMKKTVNVDLIYIFL